MLTCLQLARPGQLELRSHWGQGRSKCWNETDQGETENLMQIDFVNSICSHVRKPRQAFQFSFVSLKHKVNNITHVWWWHAIKTSQAFTYLNRSLKPSNFRRPAQDGWVVEISWLSYSGTSTKAAAVKWDKIQTLLQHKMWEDGKTETALQHPAAL